MTDPLALAELLVALIATPLLMFPGRYTVIALILVAVSWLARVVVGRRTLRHSPSDWPLLVLLLATLVSLYPSVDLSLSHPKFYGLILGYYVFSAIVEHSRLGFRVALLTAIMVGGGVGIAALGLVGADWFGRKLPIIGTVYDRLPHLITSVSTSFGTTESGFHPNEVAGTLALIFPVALGVALLGGRRFRWLTTASAVAMALVLLLTLSRSAILGATVAGVLLVVLRWRRFWVAIPAGVAGLIVVTLVFGSARVLDLLLALQNSSDLSSKSVSRVEIWDRAWLMIQDFPLTGIGLNTFPIVADKLYPFIVNGPDARLPHAHNIFLQTAVDLGIPGLAAFVALLAVIAVQLSRAWLARPGWERGLVAGLGAGLLAHVIFGLTDTVTLGAKPGLLLWVVLGTALGLGHCEPAEAAINHQDLAGGRPNLASTMGLGWAQRGQAALFATACLVGIFLF